METECRKNIFELHVFIERWLKGLIKKNRMAFQYFADALDEKFVIIHPSAERQTKTEISNGLWSAHGSHPENFSIEIRDIQVRFSAENICVMNYEEWQTGDEKSVRVSTAIFHKSENNDKCGWFHLQETWRTDK